MTTSLATDSAVTKLREKAAEIGFTMSCDDLAGSLLRTLAVSKPGGRLLELGTGVGVGSAYLLEGLAPDATLDSVDIDERLTAVAAEYLGTDRRLTIHTEDAFAYLERQAGTRYDLIFADTWAGKLEHPELALDLLAPGGIYLADDMQGMLSPPTSVPGIAPEVLRRIPEQWRELLALIERRGHEFVSNALDWSTGILICTRRST